MKRTFVTLLTVAIASYTFGVEVDVTMNAEKGPAGTDAAFKNGELFYNAVPTTPGVGSAVKVIESSDDTDFICKMYQLKTQGVVYEIKAILSPTVVKENGKVKTYKNTETGEESIVITAPAFQFPFLEEIIKAYDKAGTSYEKSGSKRLKYEPKHRLASELQEALEETLISGFGDLVIDDKINRIMIKDTPTCIGRADKYLPFFDVPAKMVRVEAQIVEIEMDDDFNFGLALEAWKEGLPENVDMTLDWSHDKADPGAGPAAWATYVAQNVQFSGMSPKAVANFINYLIRKGNAKVLSSPTVVAMNGKKATISSLDNITYKAFSEKTEPLDKQAQTGVELTITPTIATETLSLEIHATVNSVVGWSSGGTPVVNTRTTSADVILADGELFTLSGLKKEVVTQVDEGIPLLMDIPLFGMAFKHQIDVKKTSEIVVLLTPKSVTADTGITDRERQLISDVQDEMSAERTKTEKFVDRVIYK